MCVWGGVRVCGVCGVCVCACVCVCARAHPDAARDQLALAQPLTLRMGRATGPVGLCEYVRTQMRLASSCPSLASAMARSSSGMDASSAARLAPLRGQSGTAPGSSPCRSTGTQHTHTYGCQSAHRAHGTDRRALRFQAARPAAAHAQGWHVSQCTGHTGMAVVRALCQAARPAAAHTQGCRRDAQGGAQGHTGHAGMPAQQHTRLRTPAPRPAV